MSLSSSFEVGIGVVAGEEEAFAFAFPTASELLDVASELADWLSGEPAPCPLGFPVHHVDVLGGLGVRHV